jgi:polysaccharide pyruvyl transferase WcaK-like protein
MSRVLSVRSIVTGLAERASLLGGNTARAGYIGWIGNGNLGDETMFAAICRALPGIRMFHFSGNGREQFLNRFGLSGRGFFRGVVLGGGTLINPGYLPIVRRAISQRIPVYAFGTGVGSAGFAEERDPDITVWKEPLNRLRRIGVRGPDSQAALERIGVNRVEVIGDPALLLTLDELPAPRRRPRLAINLALAEGQEFGKREYTVYLTVAEIARSFIKSGGEVAALALAGSDCLALRSVVERCGAAAQVIYCHEPAEFLDAIAGSVALIGVRLHSAILSCCAGVPPILFAYRGKCRDFMRSMDLDHNLVPLVADAAPALSRAWDAIQQGGQLRERVFQKACEWRRRQQAFARQILNELTVSRRLTDN